MRPPTGAHAQATIGAAILVLVCASAAGAASAPFLPDPALTPGYVSGDTRATVCRPRYEAQHRLHRTDLAAYWRSAKIVFREYAIGWRDRRHYELDDRVPLSLGGRQRLANLWPEPRFGKRRAQGCARMAGVDPRLPRSPARPTPRPSDFSRTGLDGRIPPRYGGRCWRNPMTRQHKAGGFGRPPPAPLAGEVGHARTADQRVRQSGKQTTEGRHGADG